MPGKWTALAYQYGVLCTSGGNGAFVIDIVEAQLLDLNGRWPLRSPVPISERGTPPIWKLLFRSWPPSSEARRRSAGLDSTSVAWRAATTSGGSRTRLAAQAIDVVGAMTAENGG